MEKTAPTIGVIKLKETPQTLYTFGSIIGRGSHATVYEAKENSTGKRVAIKCVDTTRLSTREFESLCLEVEILAEVSHANIVQLYCTYESETEMYLVMELMDTDLFDARAAQPLWEEEPTRYLMQMVGNGVKYLHSRGYVHRDLKPENILLKKEGTALSIKICDFGLARCIGSGTLSTPCGTPEYIAPEILNASSYSKSVDMWALGIIMYLLLSGSVPFYDEDETRLLEHVAKGVYSFSQPHWEKISDEAKDLISHLLEKDARRRYSAEQMLGHSWFRPKLPLTLPSHHGDVMSTPVLVDDPEE